MKNKNHLKKMTDTRSGEQASIQIGVMGEIIDLEMGNFSLPDGQCFNIKNDSDQPVQLTVQLAGMEEFITTTFYVGWNPEIVKVVRMGSTTNDSLMWGY